MEGGKLKTDTEESCTKMATGYNNDASGTRMLGVSRGRLSVSPTQPFPPKA